MRIVIDMQGAQTDSRFRGVGRVTRSLTEALIRQERHEVHLALNGLFPRALGSLREQFGPLLPKGHVHVWQAVPPLALIKGKARRHHEWASAIYPEFLAGLHPDVVLVPSMMEYTSYNFFCDPTPLKGKCLLAAVVYDFIPLLQKQEYTDAVSWQRYAELLQQLRQMDVVFPISDFVREECREHLPGIPARVLPLGADALFCPGELAPAARQRLLDAFGISREFILYAGGLDERKNVRGLLQAYARLPRELSARYQLVLPCGGQAHMLEEYEAHCASLGLSGEDVRLLGYVSDSELRDLYRSCALFVFPSLNEGFGLPVVEAIRCGAPVICSNATAVPEILDWPEAFFDPRDVDDLCQKMTQALTDTKFRERLVRRALERAPLFSWKRCAEIIASALEEQGARRAAVWPDEEPQLRLARLCRQLATPSADRETVLLADALAHTFPPQQPQLLVDIGTLAIFDSRTGVQRVTRGIALELVRTPPRGWLVRFVHPAKNKGYYVYAHEAAQRLFGYDDGLEGDVPVGYGPEDIFLGLDLTVDQTVDHFDWLKTMHAWGVRMYFVVHDIIPLLFPQYIFEGVLVNFEGWLRAIAQFNGIICVSASVAGEVKHWLATKELLRPNLEIASVHNGADLEQTQPSMGLPEDAIETLQQLRTRPSILMVSTIEPRKGHRQTLAALEMLWAVGVDVNLVLVGHSGWKMDDFEATLASHPELGKRLFRLRGISDEYLAQVYDAATVVLSASEAEGFGLSLIEGARYGKPLILRDIPVFREIAGEHAFYFSGREAGDLAAALRQWLAAYARGNAPSSTGIRWSTWRESCQALLAAIGIHVAENGGKEPCRRSS
ncbi:MAG: glycosyltransferase family 4 protein [Desulfovibrio sp.]|uniref:glycosyltransferase family 4 protein n=1 Tax=Desulfovibrio sp. TaxID=885 RepID=UPI001A770C7F|nr:glycosyltransferase family 1 protein [Desulfovibrio sp.]MBD5416437.1 glycosyltransferase family 4 protein [Desulfovibrio sp.]